MRNSPIVAGVPSPYAMHVHPYPTRFRGPIYTRPVFSGQVIAKPQDVFTEGYNIDREIAQPTLSGLGNNEQTERLWNEGSGVFRPGGYGGGVFDGNLAGLGSIGARGTGKRHSRLLSRRYQLRGLGAGTGEDPMYPWKVYSDSTKALQTATNAYLKQAGMCPIAVDGKLGGATCGARNYLNVNSDQIFGADSTIVITNPSTCDQHASELIRPTSAAGGCGGGSSISPSSPTPAAPIEAGMSSSTKRALGFALGGVLAIGAVVMLRRKK
jgi:hypothetical protein